MIRYNYNKEENIIYVERHGDIILNDIFKYILDIDKNYQSLKNLSILDDVTKSTTKYTIIENSVIIEEIKRKLSKDTEVRLAILVDKPIETAYSMMFERLSMNIENFNYGTFSTKEAAKKWLLRKDS